MQAQQLLAEVLRPVTRSTLASMVSEPDWAAAADAHRQRLATALATAAAKARVEVDGQPVFGWRDRTISASVRSAALGSAWLRVVSEDRQWAGGQFWTGNTEANAITGVAKPTVMRHWEWEDGPHRLRAELMSLATGSRCSDTPELREPLALPDHWWRQLRLSLESLSAAGTDRQAVNQADITQRLLVFWGDRVTDPTVSIWRPAHTDLHWANLLRPDCVIVDWEGWGLAPAGYDAATLYLHSLLLPETAQKVRTELADWLDSRDGLVCQLYATAAMLRRIDSGDYPDLAIPLHHNAELVITALNVRR
jgi:hypothetical protein